MVVVYLMIMKTGKMSIFDRFIDLISGIFTPMLGVLCAAGMIKGFVAMFVAFNWLSENSGTYKILYSIGDGFFYFLPIVLGLTAAKSFMLINLSEWRLGWRFAIQVLSL